MRLFIAINFDEDTKDSIYNTISFLKQSGVKGSFTLRENLHLTLAFIGETNRVHEIEAIMECIHADSFLLSLDGLGVFKRDAGNILWMGIKSPPALYTVQKQLTSELVNKGFSIENRPYKPHLTLGRKIFLPNNYRFDNIFQPIKIHVSDISLMKSERINGRLTYTELYKKKLI